MKIELSSRLNTEEDRIYKFEGKSIEIIQTEIERKHTHTPKKPKQNRISKISGVIV